MAKKSARKKSSAKKAKKAARKPPQKAARKKLAAKASGKKLAAKASRKKLAAKPSRKAAKKPARKPAKKPAQIAISATTAVLATADYLPPEPTEVSADVQTAEITEESAVIDPEPPADTIP